MLVLHAACSAPFGYTLAPATDVIGNDVTCSRVGTSSPGDLAKLCKATSGCIAFNVFTATDGAIGYCLKSARSPLSDLSTGAMKGTCQGTYMGAQNAVACLGCTGGTTLAMCLRCMSGVPAPLTAVLPLRAPSARAR